MNKSGVNQYTQNPALKTINFDPDWRGTPLDRHGRFVNLNHPFVASLWQVIRWQLQRNPYKQQKKNESYHPAIVDDSSWLSGHDDVLVWLGHSTFYIRINGIQLLTDPVFGNILTVKRQSALPIDPQLFTNLKYILLSHDHRDHLDESSLQLLAKNNPGVTYLTGLGTTKLLNQITHSDAIQTAGWYQQYNTDPQAITITFIPSRHWARRGVFDTNQRLWGGFVIEAGGKRIFFSGDSGYDDHYRFIGQLFGGFDYAILGIGAYKPRWFMKPMHQSPSEALQAFEELNGQRMIPMHYGTFDLSDEPLSLPPIDLQAAATADRIADKVAILPIGKPFPI